MFRRFIVKTGYAIINPPRRLYWFIFRPNTRGVKCVLKYKDKFLLSRISYAHRLWTVHGGGVKRRETFEEAAIRETKEEVGIEIKYMEKIGTYFGTREYKNDHVDVFFAEVDKPDFKVDGIEISEAGWFGLNELPKDRASRVDSIFNMLKEYEKSRS